MAANFVNSVDFSTSIVVNFEAVRPLTSLTPLTPFLHILFMISLMLGTAETV